jgi:hypothetical protein
MNVPSQPVAGAKRIRIGVIGPPPAKGVLPDGVPVTVVNGDIVTGETPDPDLADYVGHLAQSVCMVLSDVEFVCSQVKWERGSMTDTAMLQSLTALLESDKPVDIILHPYGAPMRERLPAVFLKRISQTKILVVLAAGNDRTQGTGIFSNESPLRPGGEWRKHLAVAAAVDFKGKPAAFTQFDAEVLWALGAGPPLEWVGTSLSAALTTGAAAWLKAERPDLDPVQIVRILQETSVPKSDKNVKVINVTAALAKAKTSP